MLLRRIGEFTLCDRGPPPRRASRWVAALVAISTALTASETPFGDRIAALYRPVQAEWAALSPDGRHLAYTRHDAGELVILIVPLDQAAAKIKIIVEDDRELAFSSEKVPARLRFLHWVSAGRLVYAPTPETRGRRTVAALFAVNADGSDARELTRTEEFAVSVQVPPLPDNPDTPPPPPKFITVDRPFRVVSPLAGESKRVLIEAQGRAPLFMKKPFVVGGGSPDPWPPTLIPTTGFLLDAVFGKLTPLSDEAHDFDYLYDQQGRSRISLTRFVDRTNRVFHYRATASSGRWKKLTAIGGFSNFSLAPENYAGERSYPLGFDGEHHVLYVASNVGRDTFGVYGVNLATGQRTRVKLEHEHFDLAPLEPEFPARSLVFGRDGKLAGVRASGIYPFTAWLDPEHEALQRALKAKLPGRVIEILEWDDARQRFLVRAGLPGGPRALAIFLRAEKRLMEIVRETPWLRQADLQDVVPFAFTSRRGAALKGYLTLPRKPRLQPTPVVVYLGNEYPERVTAAFDREAQALAHMGVIVARLNHRGLAGLGLRHFNAVEGGLDRIVLADVQDAIAGIAERYKIDRKRVGLAGTGVGGYLALRALQLAPDAFRCAVALDAPLDLEAWSREELRGADESGPQVDFAHEVRRANFQRAGLLRKEASVIEQASDLAKPVLLLVDRVRDPEISAQNSRLRSRLRDAGIAHEHGELDAGFSAELPKARAAVFQRIETFFNLNLYDFTVRIGPETEVK